MYKRMTLAQVAELAGYSVPTVSMVLTGRKGTRISEGAAKKIKAAAKELGYTPDPAARSLRTGKTEAIGFVSDQVTVTRFASAMITGAAERAQAANHFVIISESGSSEDGRGHAIKALLERRVDGMVVALMQARRIEVPDRLQGVLTVIANGMADGYVGVLPDERRAGFVAASYLLERGHRKIGIIGRHPSQNDPAWSVTLTERFAGVDQAFAEASVLPRAEYAVRDWEPSGGELGLRAILTQAPDITAVICGNDRLAFGVYREAAAWGKSIPADLSVISFDDEQLASYLSPGLTTMRLPYEEIGREAADMILTGRVTEQSTLIEMPLIERESVASI